MKEAREFIMKCVFILTACVSIAAVVLICIFMFANGIPAIAKIGPLNFLLGEKWKPMNNIFGILPMIVGYFVAAKVLKLSLLNNLGSITGGMTSTPALGTLISVAGTDDVASAYAATYPIALVSVVLASQFLVVLFR